MNRRNAIKTLGITLGAGSLVGASVWAFKWSKEELPTNGFEDEELGKKLATAVETIIPETDTPGARSLGVDKFLLHLLDDCYEKEVQVSFMNSIKNLEKKAKSKFNTSFTLCSQNQREEVLIQMNMEQPKFVSLLKELTIFGYKTSEYYLRNIVKYEQVPARFDGCFSINS